MSKNTAEAYKKFKESDEIYCTPNEIAALVGSTGQTIQNAARNKEIDFPFKPVPLSEHSMRFIRKHVIQFIEGE